MSNYDYNIILEKTISPDAKTAVRVIIITNYSLLIAN